MAHRAPRAHARRGQPRAAHAGVEPPAGAGRLPPRLPRAQPPEALGDAGDDARQRGQARATPSPAARTASPRTCATRWRDKQLNDAIVAVTGASVDADETPTLVTRHSLREQRKGATILLVDPHRDSHMLAAHILRKRDSSLVVASDLAEALASLDQDVYDLVLVDTTLEGLDGPDARRDAAQPHQARPAGDEDLRDEPRPLARPSARRSSPRDSTARSPSRSGATTSSPSSPRSASSPTSRADQRAASSACASSAKPAEPADGVT